MLRRALDVLLVGLALAILDFRVDGVDLLPDPLGYGVAAWAVLAARRDGFPSGWATLAAAAFAVTAILSVPDALVHERPADGFRVQQPDALDLVQAARTAAESAALGAAMMALSAVAASRGAAGLSRHARRAAVAFAVLLGVGILLQLATAVGGIEDTWPFLLALLAADVVAFVVALVLIWRGRGLKDDADAHLEKFPSQTA